MTVRLAHPPTVLELATAPHTRTEKAEEALCDSFIARQVGRAGVVRFSQPRGTMQTLGISDRRYRVAEVAFFWEVKKADGTLRAEQIEFLEAELQYGNAVGVGTLEDLIQYVNALRSVSTLVDRGARVAFGCKLGRYLIEKYRPHAKRAKRGKL